MQPQERCGFCQHRARGGPWTARCASLGARSQALQSPGNRHSTQFRPATGPRDRMIPNRRVCIFPGPRRGVAGCGHLGFDGNVRSLGQRKSIMARTTPQQYFEMKDEEAMKTARSRAASARRNRGGKGRRPMTAAASPGRRVQFMSAVRKASVNRPGTASAASPMRGRMQPKHRRGVKSKKGLSRPQSAAPSPSSRVRRVESAPRMHARPQEQKSSLNSSGSSTVGSVPSVGLSPGGKRPQTAGALRRAKSVSGMPQKDHLEQSPSLSNTRGIRKMRPHTAIGSGHGRVSPGSSRVRPHTAAPRGGKKVSWCQQIWWGETQEWCTRYLRPTTATRTKQLYRTGQWPSGRWKMGKRPISYPSLPRSVRRSSMLSIDIHTLKIPTPTLCHPPPRTKMRTTWKNLQTPRR